MDILEYVASIKSTFHSTLPPSTAEETKNPSQLPKHQTSLSIHITVPIHSPHFHTHPSCKTAPDPIGPIPQGTRSLHLTHTHTHTPRLHLTTTTTTTNSSQKHNHQLPLQNQTYNILNTPPPQKFNSQIPIRPSAPSAPPRFILPPSSRFHVSHQNIKHRPSNIPTFHCATFPFQAA